MTEFLRRTKMVSFRLSSAEFQRFQNLCAVHGARNVSDLTRKAVHRFLSATGEADPLSAEIQDLRDQVRSISLELERLAQRIGPRNGRGNLT